MIAGETIAAISTPAGEGAIALVRVSGVDAIALRIKFSAAKKSRRDLYRTFSISEKFWMEQID